jgi:signal transduction histidine kinase
MAIACGALLLTVLALYVVFVRAVDNAQRPVRHQADERAEIRTRAEWLALTIQTAYAAGDNVTPGESDAAPPNAGAVLRNIVDTLPGFVWVLDRNGFTIYNSGRVRALPDSARSALDTLVASLPLAARVVRTSAGSDSAGGAYLRFSIARFADVQAVGAEGQHLLLYPVEAYYRLAGVNRVITGQFETPPAPADVDLWLPLLFAIPLAGIAAIAASGVFARIATVPIDERIAHLINEVEAISDGRSLHRRLPADTEIGDRLVRLTHTLNAMIGRLEQSFGGLRRFTADASHELKTPLTVLRADVERAMATQGNRPEQLEALEEALAETARMADLVDSLLTLARADEGRFDLHREPVDLEALARDVYETTTLLGERTNITVNMDSAPAATVLGDGGRLRQLFLNLVTNAIKYTPAGGSVELSLKVADGSAHFSVRDSGIGIAAADLPHVFERFWRADRARSRLGERGGFGLGLAISQYIAQAHGGALTVQSRLGRGSTFTVALPLQPAADSATQTNRLIE